MADPDPSPDLASTRLKPAEWTTAAREAGAVSPPSAPRARGRGLWLVLPWLLLVALVAALAALVSSGRLAGGLRLPGTQAPGPDVSAPVEAPPAAPALAGEVEALKSRLAALESARSEPPAAALPVAPGAAAGVEQRLELVERELRRLAEAGRMTEARIDALIKDLDSMGATSGPAATSMARARDFFILLGVRRHLERGRPLGALEPALRQQFEGREPTAVAALAAWSRAPVSERLLGDQLTAPPASPAREAEPDGMFARLWQGLRGLVELRRAEEEAVEVARDRALLALARGDLPTAIAIIEGAPAGTAPDGWKDDAQRLSMALDGLERLELIALQDSSAAVPAPQPASVLPATDPARP
ncbi:hypothetical protein [Thermaurantiacus sp.]